MRLMLGWDKSGQNSETYIYPPLNTPPKKYMSEKKRYPPRQKNHVIKKQKKISMLFRLDFQ